MRQRLLFLGTGNSCRSQMAEGWTRHLKSEAGVDIASQPPQTLADLEDLHLDVVVTVCDEIRAYVETLPESLVG